jgi:hypothetical protein
VGKIVDKEDELTDTDQDKDVVVHERGERERKRGICFKWPKKALNASKLL